MAFPIVWAVGSFVGGLLAKEFYDDVIADNYEDNEEEKENYNDEFIAALYEKLLKANDAKGLYDFGCILEAGDKDWAKLLLKQQPIWILCSHSKSSAAWMKKIKNVNENRIASIWLSCFL